GADRGDAHPVGDGWPYIGSQLPEAWLRRAAGRTRPPPRIDVAMDRCDKDGEIRHRQRQRSRTDGLVDRRSYEMIGSRRRIARHIRDITSYIGFAVQFGEELLRPDAAAASEQTLSECVEAVAEAGNRTNAGDDDRWSILVRHWARRGQATFSCSCRIRLS